MLHLRKALNDDIIWYSSQGEVFLVGDFNARTQTRQCTIIMMYKNLEVVSVDPLAIRITRRSKEQGGDATSFGHHLLELGSRHQMIICNALAKWLGSEELTCFPHGDLYIDNLKYHNLVVLLPQYKLAKQCARWHVVRDECGRHLNIGNSTICSWVIIAPFHGRDYRNQDQKHPLRIPTLGTHI